MDLTGFPEARVLVVGDLMLDRYWYGSTGRISPEAPVPVVRVNGTEDRLGGAGNVALNVASLGVNATLLAITGDDEAADTITEQLSAAAIKPGLIRCAAGTTTKLRVVSRHQQLIRLDFEDRELPVDYKVLQMAFAGEVENCDVVVFSDYAKGCLFSIEALIELAKQNNRTVLVDPKGTDFSRYRGADVLTPNLAEFEAVVGACDTEQDIEDRARDLISGFALGAILITRGEQGMSLVTASEAHHMPTQAREVFDVTGAGDTVIGVMASSLAAGKDLVQAMRLANAAAGIVVGKLGTATASTAELDIAINGSHTQTVIDEDRLMFNVEAARQRGEVIVMTNGCFDLLHAGHIDYLRRARQLGDRLVVAVNTDESVKGLKGASRPIVPLQQRMAVLSALEMVDWVVPFDESTPERLICKILPDLLVKGGDYKADEIAGGDCVRNNGGEVKILPFMDGCSTSDIVERIKAADE